MARELRQAVTAPCLLPDRDQFGTKSPCPPAFDPCLTERHNRCPSATPDRVVAATMCKNCGKMAPSGGLLAVLVYFAHVATLLFLDREAAAKPIRDTPTKPAAEVDPCRMAVERLAKAQATYVPTRGESVVVGYMLQHPWLESAYVQDATQNPDDFAFRTYAVIRPSSPLEFYFAWAKGSRCTAVAIAACANARLGDVAVGTTAQPLSAEYSVYRNASPALLEVRIGNAPDAAVHSVLAQLIEIGASPKVHAGCCARANGRSATARLMGRSEVGPANKPLAAGQFRAAATWREPPKRGRRVTEWQLDHKRSRCRATGERTSVRLDPQDVVSIEVLEVQPNTADVQAMLTRTLTNSTVTNALHRCGEQATPDGRGPTAPVDSSVSVRAATAAATGRLAFSFDSAVSPRLAECLDAKLTNYAERAQRSLAFSAFKLVIRYRWSAGD